MQYGPRITAIILYLYVGQFLSKKRTASALAELFGSPVCAGAVAAMTSRAAGALGGFTGWVRARLAAEPVVHFDETGLRVEGKLRWGHSASTGNYSLIYVHDRRGTEGMDAAGVLPAFTGIAVHDAWAPYDTYQVLTHALCNAHLLRELQAVTDLAEQGSWCWATQAGDALRELNDLVSGALAACTNPDGADLGRLDPVAVAGAVHRYRSAALRGVDATRARTSKLMRKHNALAHRLLDRQDDYLRFTVDPRVPFNNNAERDRRMIKLWQKVSGYLRTLTGTQQFCAIRSYLATAAKHGVHFLAALTTLAEGRPWLPATT